MSVTQLISKAWNWMNQQRPIGVKAALVNQPLLSASDTLQLAQELAALNLKLSANPKQSDALRQGEQPSQFMGSGMEYEESRPYVEGDEIRRIHWKLMAKTGKAYTKLFQEERQENWFILLDHRSSMRFGSKTRLKATQAIRVAGYYAWLAQQQAIPVAMARLAETFEVSPIFEGRRSFTSILELANKPCPPLDAVQSPAIALNEVLLKINQQLAKGSRLIIISDFQDADAKTTEILSALQAHNVCHAVLISDALERHLPAIAGVSLQTAHSQQSYVLSEMNSEYNHWSASYFAKLKQNITLSGALFADIPAHFSSQQMHQVLQQNLLNGR